MFELRFFSKSVLTFVAFAMILSPFVNAGFQQDLQQSIDFIAAETKQDPNTLKTNIKQGIGLLSRILDNSYKLPETADGDRELESVNQAIIHFALRKKQALPSAVKEFKGDHQFFPATATVNYYFHPNNELKGIPFTKREIRSVVRAALPYLDTDDTKVVSPSSTPSFFDVHASNGKKDDNLSKLNHYYAEIVSSNSDESNAVYARAICATGNDELKAFVVSCDIGSRPQLKSPIQRERSNRPSIDSSLLDAGKLRRLYAFTYRKYCEVKFAEAKSNGGTLPESCRDFLRTESAKVDNFIDKNRKKLQKEYADTFERTLHKDKTLTSQRMAQYIAFTECPEEMRTIPFEKLRSLGNMILDTLAAEPTESAWSLESAIRKSETRRSKTKSQSSDEESDDEEDESHGEHSYTNNQNQNTESQDSENQGSETKSPSTENRYPKTDRKRPQTQFNDVKYARALAAHLLNRSSHTVKEKLDYLGETKSRPEIQSALKEAEEKQQSDEKLIRDIETEATQRAKADSWSKQARSSVQRGWAKIKLTAKNAANYVLKRPSLETSIANLERALSYSTLEERANLHKLDMADKLLKQALDEIEQDNHQQTPNQSESKVDNQQLNQDEHKSPPQHPVTQPEQKRNNQQAPIRAGNKGNHEIQATRAGELLDDVQEYYLDHVSSEALAAEKIRLEGVYETYRANLSHRAEYKTAFSPHSDWMQTEIKMMLTDLSQIRLYARSLPEFAASSEKISKLMDYMKSGLFPNCSEGLKKDSVLVQASEVLMNIYLDLSNKLRAEQDKPEPDLTHRPFSEKMKLVLSKLYPLTTIQCPNALAELKVAHELDTEIPNIEHLLDKEGLAKDAPRSIAWVTDPANSGAMQNLSDVMNRKSELIGDIPKTKDFLSQFFSDISLGKPEVTTQKFAHVLDLFAQKWRRQMSDFLTSKYENDEPDHRPTYIGRSIGFADLVRGESKLYNLLTMHHLEADRDFMYPILVEQQIRCDDPTNPDCQKQHIKFYFLPYATEAQKAEIHQAFARTPALAL